MATKTFTLTSAGTSLPSGATTDGPLTDTLASAVKTAGTLTLSTSFQQITVPSTANNLCLFMTGNAINITIAGASGDTGINLGSGWTWVRLPIVGGTTTFWVKAASGTPSLNYEFN